MDSKSEDFASQFGDAFEIESDGSEGGMEDSELKDGREGDDVIPTFDLNELQSESVSSFTGANVSSAAQQARERAAVRVGENKSNPLEELRSVYKVSDSLHLSRDFTERYLFKISADGYHVGWCLRAGNDYDFYNTKHEIIHSMDKNELPQLSDPKLLGMGEPSAATLTDIKKAFGTKAELNFPPDTTKGYMHRVSLNDGKQLGWACKSGRDVEFFDMRGKSLLKVAQRSVPKLAVGKRDVMMEVRRCYRLEKVGVRLLRASSKLKSNFKYRVCELTDKEKEVGWANLSAGYFVFFDKDGKKRLHAVSRHEMPKKDTWKGHSKSFGISKEITSTATGTEYKESGTRPQGIFGLLDPTQVPGYDPTEKSKEPKQGDDKSKKKAKKPKKEKKKPKQVKTIVHAGLF